MKSIPPSRRMTCRIRRGVAALGSLALLLPLSLAQSPSERRIIVGGLNEQGHFVYTFKGTSPLVHVSTINPQVPKTIRLSNRSGRTLKIQLFNGGDEIRAIPRQTLTLASGKAHSMPFQIYHAKVFEPGLVDRLAASGLSIGSNAEIRSRTINGKKTIEVKDTANLFSVSNGTRESIQVSIFNLSDSARVIPLGALTIAAGKSAVWPNPPSTPFRLRIHPDKLIASPLSLDRTVNAYSQVSVVEREWSPWKTLNQQHAVNGRFTETNEPLVVPALESISVDPLGFSPSASSRNYRHPRLYTRDAKGNLWTLRLDDSPVEDGLAQVLRSTDWRLTAADGGVSWPFGPFSSTPFVVDQELVFAQSSNGDPIYKPLYVPVPSQGMNTKGEWSTLGNGVRGRPVAVAYGPRSALRYLALLRDPADGSVRAISRDLDGKWGDWQSLGGSIRGNPAACALHEGVFDSTVVSTPTSELKSQVHVFARGMDSTLMHRVWREGSGWGPWESLGGVLISDPSVQSENILTGPENKRTFRHRIHVAAKGTNGKTLYRMFDGAKWSAWTTIGPALATIPVIFQSEDKI